MCGLKQEAPEEEYAQQQDERDDDDFNQTHSRFLKRLSVRVDLQQQMASRTSLILNVHRRDCQRKRQTHRAHLFNQKRITPGGSAMFR
jgi:hypothetical protein